MENAELVDLFAKLSTPLIADAALRLKVPVRFATAGIKAVVPATRLAGRVLPARHFGSVDVFLEAMEQAEAGDVLVNDNAGRLDEGCIGDLTVLEAKAAQLAGLIVWGAHRDTAELERIGVPVFTFGAFPSGPPARAGVSGTFVLFDRKTDTMLVWNEARAKERFAPASTFKIANSLIGLDVGAVKDVEEVLPYGGKPQWIKGWEQDMNLRNAIKISNVAIYQELARRIGIERMRDGVKKLGYGNMEIGQVVDRFWLDGPLAISAVEQTEFLSRLVDGKLPVSAEAMRAVEEITLLEKTDTYELHGKTGWLFDKHLGWWVGWVKRDGKSYPFALNIDMKENADAEKRIPMGRECLKALGRL